MFKRGDEVITVQGLWHEGEDISERLATVIGTDSYILISIHTYNNNPVKVFPWEIEGLEKSEGMRLRSDEEIEELFSSFDPLVGHQWVDD